MLNGDYILKRELNDKKYNLYILDSIELINKDNNIQLLNLIKKILLSSNNSYYNYFISELKKELLNIIFGSVIILYVLLNLTIYIIENFSENTLFAQKFYEYYPEYMLKMKISNLLILLLPELIILSYRYLNYSNINIYIIPYTYNRF